MKFKNEIRYNKKEKLFRWTPFLQNKREKQTIAFYFAALIYHYIPSTYTMNKILMFSFSFSFRFSFFGAFYFAGQSGHTSRQFFPYVSSESDLQHYKTISFRHSHNHEHRASSSLSNVPSDFKSDRCKVCVTNPDEIIIFF